MSGPLHVAADPLYVATDQLYVGADGNNVLNRSIMFMGHPKKRTKIKSILQCLPQINH